MAEVFGVVAGALTVIELSAKIVRTCKYFIETTQDAPKDIRHIFIEVASLKSTLESVQFLFSAESNFSHEARNRSDFQDVVKACQTTLEELAAELDRVGLSKIVAVGFTKKEDLKESLKWCFKEKKARKLLDEIAQHKSTISLVLIDEVQRDVKDVKSDVKWMRDGLEEANRRKLCNWLERINPTMYHNQASGLHETDTCSWIELHDQFKDWIAGSQRFVWIYGIPGAGKTVLFSHVVEVIRGLCNSRDKKVYIYFYYHYSQSGDQTFAFLSWVVSQLCRTLGFVPDDLCTMFKSNTEPTSKILIHALECLLERTQVVYLLLDAVDECKAKQDTLRLLSEFSQNPAFAQLQLLVTSRNESDIKQSLDQMGESISMSNELIDADIRIYVTAELKSNSRFRTWSNTLRDDIADALVKGAKGMFRWASCQLQILQRKRREIEIRKALTELPESIDETYERILCEVPHDQRVFARSMLLWICFHDMMSFGLHMSTDCLVTGTFFPSSPVVYQAHDYDKLDLLDLCICLTRSLEVRGNLGETLETTLLAHYTVKEFLFSERIKYGKAEYFRMSKETVFHECTQIMLDRCMNLDLEATRCDYYTNFDTYCHHALEGVASRHPKLFLETEILWIQFITYLKTPRTYLFYLLPLPTYEKQSGYIQAKCMGESYSSSAMTEKCLSLMNLMTCRQMFLIPHFVEFSDVNDHELWLSTRVQLQINSSKTKTSIEGSLLEVIWPPEPIFLRDVWNSLVEILPQDLVGLYILAAHDHRQCSLPKVTCTIDYILSTGLHADCVDSLMTPLQIVVYRWDLEGTNSVLKGNPKVNQVGNPNGHFMRHFDTSWTFSSPLHIIRNTRYSLDHLGLFRDKEGRTKDRSQIERLLVAHGAEDFVLNDAFERVFEGSQSFFFPEPMSSI